MCVYRCRVLLCCGVSCGVWLFLLVLPYCVLVSCIVVIRCVLLCIVVIDVAVVVAVVDVVVCCCCCA